MFKFLSIFLLWLGITGFTTQALAAPVTIPNSFSAGTPAVAAEVNDNFAAVKTAVDDNDSRLQAIESGSVSFNLVGLIDSVDGNSCNLIRSPAGYIFYAVGSGGVCSAYMPVTLPHGRTLSTMRCTVFDNDGVAPANVDSIGLSRSPITGAAAQIIFATPSSVDSSSVQQLVDTSPVAGTAVVNNTNYSYFILASIDESNSGTPWDIRAYNCVITYQ